MAAGPTTGELERAVEILRRGGLVAFPTETVYGLGADAGNATAVERIFAAKGRPRTHPLIVHLPTAEYLPRWAVGDLAVARRLAERFWPGPLTLVMRRQGWVLPLVTGGADTVALRVPAHPLALALLARFGGGLAAPSANPFGSISPTTAQHVRAGLGDAVDLVLDGGPCAVGVESTILDLSGDVPAILRPGGVPRELLEEVMGRPIAVPSRPTVPSPGQHGRHYSPHAQLVVVSAERLAEEARHWIAAGRRVGVLQPADAPLAVSGLWGIQDVPMDIAEYGRRLYAMLFELDQRGCDVILAALPSPEGLGAAIADRLRRAAGQGNLPIVDEGSG
ncbi:MAG: threonylcarbamoyl-AMP synthase [Acidobacteriota bacterium]|jgi:L-threonylcarbamoyladenylate synthase